VLSGLAIHCWWLQQLPVILTIADELKWIAHSTDTPVSSTYVAEVEEVFTVVWQAVGFQQTNKT